MNKLIRKFAAVLAVCVLLFGISACGQTQKPSGETQAVRATVIDIEKYGHAVLDVTTADFYSAGFDLGDVVCVRFGDSEWQMPFLDGYYTTPGEKMLRGTAPEENIAVCINYGHLSKETGIAPGDDVEITMMEKAGMLAFQELFALKYSDDRADFSSDAVFANFRPVTAGSIGQGKLYRSASPINNQYGRAGYANGFIEAAGVATVLNLADSVEDIESYCGAEDFDSAYYRSLYESGQVIALDLAVNFYSDEFATALVEGLRFLARNDAPYSIHCTEGKDRAGFTVMLLEALMGAELQEIIDDYMTSFYNYYGISREGEPERYEAVLNHNLTPMLCYVMGTASLEELEQTDLQAAVTAYLLRAGMTEDEILTLREKLS